MQAVHVVEDLGAAVGQHWRRLQNLSTREQATFTYAAPLSSTPLPIYRWVLEDVHSFQNWSATQFILMDEQVEQDTAGGFHYIDRDDEASYERFAEVNFIRPLNRALKTSSALTVAKPNLEALQQFNVTLDMLILAIGVDGNYANVMPGTSLNKGWHVTKLSAAFRQIHTAADSQSYSNATFREYGMSLGPRQVLDAREVILIASGARKRDLFQRLMQLSAPDSEYPISIVHDRSLTDRVHIYVTPDVL
jgi:6-phosphogluconolactonase/glucosamine-6-phosphate isomerase/deaminase